MKLQTIKTLSNNFESYANEINGVEFWFARDLQKLLGYSKWVNFEQVIDKAKTACSKVGQRTTDHFADAGKTINMPKTAEKDVKEYQEIKFPA